MDTNKLEPMFKYMVIDNSKPWHFSTFRDAVNYTKQFNRNAPIYKLVYVNEELVK